MNIGSAPTICGSSIEGPSVVGVSATGFGLRPPSFTDTPTTDSHLDCRYARILSVAAHLEPWLILAQTYNIAIICVTHFAKDTNRSMLHRVLGSSAFVQTCRSLCAVMEQPRTEEEQPDPHAKVFMQVKMNLPEHPGGAWKFHTERVEVGIDHRNGKPIYATRPAWDELDAGLTPNSTVGKARGPKSQYEPQFAMWFQGFYLIYPNHEWLPVSTVKQVALQEKVVSASWWDKHSADHMQKENIKGTWMCRPKQTAPAKE